MRAIGGFDSWPRCLKSIKKTQRREEQTFAAVGLRRITGLSGGVE